MSYFYLLSVRVPSTALRLSRVKQVSSFRDEVIRPKRSGKITEKEELFHNKLDRFKKFLALDLQQIETLPQFRHGNSSTR